MIVNDNSTHLQHHIYIYIYLQNDCVFNITFTTSDVKNIRRRGLRRWTMSGFARIWFSNGHVNETRKTQAQRAEREHSWDINVIKMNFLNTTICLKKI